MTEQPPRTTDAMDTLPPTDYLWDRSGEPDPFVQQLERTLGGLRVKSDATISAPDAAAMSPANERRLQFPRRRRMAWLAAAAVLALAGTAGVLMTQNSWQSSSTDAGDGRGWRVTALTGTPLIESDEFAGESTLAVGQSLVTDSASSARLTVADLGWVTIDPLSSIQLATSTEAQRRLDLRYGRIEAFITAPQRVFFVDTPLATAIDLGCAYTLEVDRADGTALLQVTAGWVAFERHGREVEIPRGGMCRTYPDVGPGTPHYEDADPDLIAALEQIDRGIGNAASLGRVLELSGPDDTLTLWHLIDRVPDGDRARVARRLAELAPPPTRVTIDGVLNHDQAMRQAWRDALHW